MEHRQDRFPVVEGHQTVRVRHSLDNAGIPGSKVGGPLFLCGCLGEIGAAAGMVRTEVGVGMRVLTALRQLVVDVGTLGRGLGLQRLHLKGGGHLTPDHAHKVVPQRHPLRCLPGFYGQHDLPVLLRLRCLRRRLVRLRGGEVGAAEEQHHQNKGRRRAFFHGCHLLFYTICRACPGHT